MDEIKAPTPQQNGAEPQGTNQKKPRNKKRRRITWLISILIIAFIGGGLFLWYRYNQSPAQGTILQSPTQTQSAEITGTKPFKGKAIGFDYLARYSVPEKQTIKAPVTEAYVLKYQNPQTGSQKIALMVTTPTANTPVFEDSAYTYRKNNPALYTASTEQFNGQTYTKMTKKDKTEVSYFVPGAGKYAVITITSSNPETDITKDLSYIIQSINWL